MEENSEHDNYNFAELLALEMVVLMAADMVVAEIETEVQREHRHLVLGLEPEEQWTKVHEMLKPKTEAEVGGAKVKAHVQQYS